MSCPLCLCSSPAPCQAGWMSTPAAGKRGSSPGSTRDRGGSLVQGGGRLASLQLQHSIQGEHTTDKICSTREELHPVPLTWAECWNLQSCTVHGPVLHIRTQYNGEKPLTLALFLFLGHNLLHTEQWDVAPSTDVAMAATSTAARAERGSCPALPLLPPAPPQIQLDTMHSAGSGQSWQHGSPNQGPRPEGTNSGKIAEASGTHKGKKAVTNHCPLGKGNNNKELL